MNVLQRLVCDTREGDQDIAKAFRPALPPVIYDLEYVTVKVLAKVHRSCQISKCLSQLWGKRNQNAGRV